MGKIVIEKPRFAEIASKLANGRKYNAPQKDGNIYQVWHAMAQYIDFENATDKHAKDHLDASNLAAHFLIEPSGVIIQTLPIDVIGAHARGKNSVSVGIELLVGGLHTYGTFLDTIKKPYLTKEQYKAAVHLAAWLVQQGYTELERHSDISPGRKYDPGTGFYWSTFNDHVNEMIATGRNDFIDGVWDELV